MVDLEQSSEIDVGTSLYAKAEVVDLSPQSYRFYEAFQELGDTESMQTTGEVADESVLSDFNISPPDVHKKQFKPMDAPEFQPALKHALETHRQAKDSRGGTVHFFDVTELSKISVDETPDNTEQIDNDSLLKMIKDAATGPLVPVLETKVVAENQEIFMQICQALADKTTDAPVKEGHRQFNLKKMGLAENIGVPKGEKIDKAVRGVSEGSVKAKTGERYVLIVPVDQ